MTLLVAFAIGFFLGLLAGPPLLLFFVWAFYLLGNSK